MKLKNILTILVTIAVAVLVCYYLIITNQAFDGGLIITMSNFIVTFPLLAALSLRQPFRDKTEPIKPSPQWEKIVSGCILLGCIVFVLYLWIDSGFYNVSALMAMVMVAVLIPLIFLDKQCKQFSTKYPIQSWALGFTVIYLLSAATVFTYLQVVQPVTVEDATAIVTETYGNDGYQFSHYRSLDRNEHPLGTYRFSQDGNWVQVDILTGAISDV